MGLLENLGELAQGNEKIVPYTEVQARRLVASAKNKRDRVMLVLVLNSGISQDDMLNMRVSDIDFQTNEITIYNKPPRNIKIASGVIRELKEYLGDTSE